MNHINLFPFISLINKENDAIQCNTCLERIKDTYIVDCKDDNTYCDSDCLAHSFEFNLFY